MDAAEKNARPSARQDRRAGLAFQVCPDAGGVIGAANRLIEGEGLAENGLRAGSR